MSQRPDESYSPERLHDFYEQTVRRGTTLRRRRLALMTGVLALVVVVVVLPLAALTTSGGSSQNTTLVVVGSGPYADVAWHSVKYPGVNFATAQYPHSLGCGINSAATPTGYVFPVQVLQVSYVQPHGAPRLAIVLVRCQAGSPTPSALYAFDSVGANGTPHVFQVLLRPPSTAPYTFWNATSFSVAGSTIVMQATGSDARAPICCPDIAAIMRWRWNGHRFVGPMTITKPHTGGVGP